MSLIWEGDTGEKKGWGKNLDGEKSKEKKLT